MLKRIEYVRLSLFATLAQMKRAERKQAKLIAAGYTLIHQSGGESSYKCPDKQATI